MTKVTRGLAGAFFTALGPDIARSPELVRGLAGVDKVLTAAAASWGRLARNQILNEGSNPLITQEVAFLEMLASFAQAFTDSERSLRRDFGLDHVIVPLEVDETTLQ